MSDNRSRHDRLAVRLSLIISRLMVRRISVTKNTIR